MNNEVPDGHTLHDFFRAMNRPAIDIAALPDDLRRWLIRMEIQSYMLWLTEKPHDNEEDTEEIPF